MKGSSQLPPVRIRVRKLVDRGHAGADQAPTEDPDPGAGDDVDARIDVVHPEPDLPQDGFGVLQARRARGRRYVAGRDRRAQEATFGRPGIEIHDVREAAGAGLNLGDLLAGETEGLRSSELWGQSSVVSDHGSGSSRSARFARRVRARTHVPVCLRRPAAV